MCNSEFEEAECFKCISSKQFVLVCTKSYMLFSVFLLAEQIIYLIILTSMNETQERPPFRQLLFWTQLQAETIIVEKAGHTGTVNTY